MEVGEDSFLLWSCGGGDDFQGLVAMRGEDYVVESLGSLPICKLEENLTVWGVGDGRDSCVEEEVVWREAFHDGVNVGARAVGDCEPLGSSGYSCEEVVIPPLEAISIY